MKKLLITLLLFLSISLPASAFDTLLSASIDWMFSIRGGIEYRFHRYIGIKSDIGLAIFGLLVLDTFCVFYILPEDSSFRLNFLIGISNAATTLTFKAGMISFGGSVSIGYKLTETVSMDLRIGAGFPLFFEKGKDIIRDTHLPLNLWPDLTLAVHFKI